MGRTFVRTFPAIVALTLCFACDESLSSIDVAGTYALSSTSGTISRLETPVSGFLVLAPNGSAVRRMSYYRDSTMAITEFVAVGTYHIADSSVYLALREDNGPSANVWRVTATFESSGRLRLAYPRPADGTIVEVYQRQ